jgi:hypothetical protein
MPVCKTVSPQLAFVIAVCFKREKAKPTIKLNDSSRTVQSFRRFSGSVAGSIPNNPSPNEGFYLLDAGQLVSIYLPKVFACQANTALVTVGISGLTSEPLERNWSGPWGLWHGPHASESWPQIGNINPISGSFNIQGLVGNWALPDSVNVKVTGQDLTPGWLIDSSTPSPSIADKLVWSGTNEITPSAQLTDTASVALLQDWIVVFAVCFGIGSAILASLLFELIRPGRHQSETFNRRNISEPSNSLSGLWHPHRTRRRVLVRLGLLGLTFIVGYARGRRRRHEL